MTRSSRVALVAVLCAGVAWGFAHFVRWAPTHVKRGSLAYTLKVPGAAKAIALWSPDTAPLYDVVRNDGLANGYTSIQYRSRKPPRDLEPAIVASGYECQWVGAATLTCDRSHEGALQSQVTVQYDDAERMSDVIVHLPTR